MKRIALLFAVSIPVMSFGQSSLTIEKIMQDPKWIGTSPSNPFWSVASDTLFFSWNPENNLSDSLYFITLNNLQPQKVAATQKSAVLSAQNVQYNAQRTAIVFSKNGDIFYKSIKPAKSIQITNTVDFESNPRFSFNGMAVVYQREQNLYSWNIATGQITQLTNVLKGQSSAGGQLSRNSARNGSAKTKQEAWLEGQQTQYIQVLRERKAKKDAATAYNKQHELPQLRRLDIGNKQLSGLSISPDGGNIAYRLIAQPVGGKGTIVPDYVTESGYTTDIPGRKKVGEPLASSSFFIYDRDLDSLFQIKTDQLDGVREIPEFYKDYPAQYDSLKKKNAPRPVNFGYFSLWSPDGNYLLFDARSQDNKDRWVLIWDAVGHNLIQADHQHDQAWIGGPGIYSIGWINGHTIFYQSEKTGYSHLYLYDVSNQNTRSLTKGNYEVQNAVLSQDKKTFYITTNQVEPGQQQFYKLDIASGKQQRITTMVGANDVTVSPDGKNLAVLYSYSNKPWELYLQKNEPDTKAVQVTDKAESKEWKAYPWRDPELISFTARDGAKVYARVFKPDNPRPGMPAVVFVHGAGYLQNAHKWWSSYFRENMFHNFLADNGYYVIDADYRGSAGYGRDWRTGIYRFMGGKDLTDNVDAAAYLVKTYQVDPNRIGIYGGSYGGFMTLMAMFTTPGVFAAGAGLRSVTEWANYNHGYTSNILNEPYNDSIAYRRSSPIYFAEGLKGHLLMCHGLIDLNVHAQDIIKLTQRLIELKKENWNLALYPLEDHGFVEPTSWMDEYKRIFNLFESVLKK